MPHAIKGCKTMEEFVALHENQLKSSGIHEKYWSNLYEKLSNEFYDAGDHFMIQKVLLCDDDDEDDDDVDDDEDVNDLAAEDSKPENFRWKVIVSSDDGISLDNPNHIFLIDHAWTYRVRTARGQLEQTPHHLQRMAALMDITVEGKDQKQLVEEVLEEMWRYNRTYKIGNADRGSEDAEPIWYIMDEFGSRIQHSDDASFRIVPFYYIPSQIIFSVMFPVQNLSMGDEVTRNYIEDVGADRLTRKLRLLPWQPEDMTHLSFEQKDVSQTFFEEYKEQTTLPPSDAQPPSMPRDRNIRIFSAFPYISNALTDPRFEVVTDEKEADILWVRQNFNDYKGLYEVSPNMLINQYPCEHVITVKDLMATVARRSVQGGKHTDTATLETLPKWLPTTFDLKTELPQFVSYFQQREERGLDNHWICKPWNLARALDCHVTNNLNYILRLPETGPKIANKYVENPVLYQNVDGGPVKFDLRFLILLRSVDPLTVYVHKKFHVRLANKAYSLDTLDDYEKHFTVMHLKGFPTKMMKCEQFISDIETHYPDQEWSNIEKSVHEMLMELVKAAVSCPPPCGIAPCQQSRAIYGADVILMWDENNKGERVVQPKLLELNFTPNVDKMCIMYPDFFNDCFSVLVCDDIEGRDVVQLA